MTQDELSEAGGPRSMSLRGLQQVQEDGPLNFLHPCVHDHAPSMAPPAFCWGSLPGKLILKGGVLQNSYMNEVARHEDWAQVHLPRFTVFMG